jgi:hypothetical protein
MLRKLVKRILHGRRLEFENSAQYWEDRYAMGGTSGAGSYNRLAEFKAEFINKFVEDHSIKSVIEFGVGDGAQLSLAKYPSFVGVDVSPTILETCRAKFAGDNTKRFCTPEGLPSAPSELALSLDVIYHLVEDIVFTRYMLSLFASATRFVVIYSSDKDEGCPYSHIRHRNFTRWVAEHWPEWTLQETVQNRYPFDPDSPDNTSFANFFIYARNLNRSGKSLTDSPRPDLS